MSGWRFWPRLPCVLLPLLACCATLADGEPGLDNAPSSRAGPFRLLVTGEVGAGHDAPVVMDERSIQLSDVALLDQDGDPQSPAMFGFFTATDENGQKRIVRLSADDGRSFESELGEVLTPSSPWEAGSVEKPSVVRGAQGELLLYYAGSGGIGLAEQSAAGTPFSGRALPVLDRDAVGYGETPPTSPSVLRMPDGSYRMFFATEAAGRKAIGRASSQDGRLWFADSQGPVLEAGPPGSLDDLGVSAPSAVLAESAEGRSIVYLYYLAEGSDGKSRIGMAARFLAKGEAAAFEKSEAVMYAPATGTEADEPFVARFPDYTLLFVSQKLSKQAEARVLVAGVSPGNASLGP